MKQLRHYLMFLSEQRQSSKCKQAGRKNPKPKYPVPDAGFEMSQAAHAVPASFRKRKDGNG